MTATFDPGRWRGILFDFDGTLADTAPDLAAAANAMRVERGMAPMALEPLRQVASQGARGLLRVAFAIGPDDDGYEALRDEFLSRYAANMSTHTKLFDGVLDVLDALERDGLAWGIVTNKAKRFTDPLVIGLNLASRAGVVVSGDSTPFTKPHPAPLLFAAESLDLPPSECVYVGDDHRDIVAGRAAGMDTIAAAWGYCATLPTQWEADAVLAHPGELLTLI